MKKEIERIVPTLELLSEMEELQVYGGEGDTIIHVHSVVGCNVTNSGNCVAGCGCSIPQPTYPPVIPAEPVVH